ncbi:MAG: hypothetical protein IPJ88_03955 [Myxococcales bacterium]|nr:MAG: hypothetical protein IPJ88_03955 [Myxococcales bacterium]
MPFAKLWMVALFLLGCIACTPEIGDNCSSSVDCSVSGDRLCDRSVQGSGGYCTVAGCDEQTCPDSAVCVKFRSEPSRLSTTWCMASCGSNGDCRTDDGFRCVLDSELGEENFATVLEGSDRRFCAYLPAE